MGGDGAKAASMTASEEYIKVKVRKQQKMLSLFRTIDYEPRRLDEAGEVRGAPSRAAAAAKKAPLD